MRVFGCVVLAFAGGACAVNDVHRTEAELWRRPAVSRGAPRDAGLRAALHREGADVVVEVSRESECEERWRDVHAIEVTLREKPERGGLTLEWLLFGVTSAFTVYAVGAGCGFGASCGDALFIAWIPPALTGLPLAVDYTQASTEVRRELRTSPVAVRLAPCGAVAATGVTVTWMAATGAVTEAVTDDEGEVRFRDALRSGPGDVLVQGRLVGHVEPRGAP